MTSCPFYPLNVIGVLCSDDEKVVIVGNDKLRSSLSVKESEKNEKQSDLFYNK